MTINLSFENTLDNTDTEKISAFRFHLYWLLSCLCFTRSGWLCDFPPKKTQVAFGLPYCWLSYFTLVCLWCGRTVGRVYGHVITNFLGWVDYQIFLPMVLRFARVELRYKCNHCSKTFKLRSSRFIHTRKYPGQGNIFNLVPRALFPGPGDEVATSFVAKSVLSLHPENRLRINTILKHMWLKSFSSVTAVPWLINRKLAWIFTSVHTPKRNHSHVRSVTRPLLTAIV